MSYPPSSFASESSVANNSHFDIRSSLAVIVTTLVLAVGFAHASTAPGAQTVLSADCHVAEPNGDSSVNIHALDDYSAFVRHLLVQGRYNELDCIADRARSNKTKFSGGFWKIHTIYRGLSSPVDEQQHATQTDWDDHIERLQHWISAKPKSVTPRIALAQTYIGFAWQARGEGFADTVTDNGWKLIGERTEQAEQALKEAYKLPTKCPEWYLTVEQLLQLQGTTKEQLSGLLNEAIALEPTYQYLYRIHANLLAAKWYGDKGDEEAFAESAADRLGGGEGDILYFEITSHMICTSCNDALDLKLLSWPRMQKGFKALTEKTGASLVNLNQLAYMANQEGDPATATQIFTQIADNWDPDLWHTKAFFDSSKQWAAQAASAIAWEKSLEEKAEADMRTPEGIEIKKKFDESFAAKIQGCAASVSSTELQPFSFLVTLGEEGRIRTILAFPSTRVSDCVIKSGPFLVLQPPSHAPFSLKIDIDPSKLMTASLH